jgi:hypothetical protein
VEVVRHGCIERDERPGLVIVGEMESRSIGPTVNSTLESGVEPEPFARLLNAFPFPKIVYQAFCLFTGNPFLRIVPEIDDVLGLCVVGDDTPERITDSVFQV